MQEWLSEEEQYREHLSCEQISRIKDPKLRDMRLKHWKHRNKIFLNETNISDAELIRLTEEDWEKEKKELEDYRNK